MIFFDHVIKGQRDVTYAKLRLCGVEIPLGSVVELSNFADFMCFMGLFSKCPIGALLVGAIEQVETKALLFTSSQRRKIINGYGSFVQPGLISQRYQLNSRQVQPGLPFE